MSDKRMGKNLRKSDLYKVQGVWRKDILRRLRVCVTDQCNFDCFFCHNEGQGQRGPAQDSMTVSEICGVIEAAVLAGVEHVKLTGGEPLTYRDGGNDIVDLVGSITEMRDVERQFSLSLVTNGFYLQEKAQRLKEAGLDRVTVSVYSLASETLKLATRTELPDVIDQILEGIREAVRVGLTPVKINMLLFHAPDQGISNIREIEDVFNLCQRESIDELRLHTLIWHPDFPDFDDYYTYWDSELLSPISWLNTFGNDDVRKRILADLREFTEHWAEVMYPQAKFIFTARNPHISVDAMQYGRFEQEGACGACPHKGGCQEGPYALRILVNGTLKGCLLSPESIDVLGPLRKGASTDELADLFKDADRLLPAEHEVS